MCVPEGNGMLTAANRVICKAPERVFLHRNKKLHIAIRDCRVLLREATKNPTRCSELVMGEPDYIGVKDASIHGVGGVVFGEGKACVPTVFRMEWPQWVKDEVRKTNSGQGGYLTNSDLEMAGLVLLFLIIEKVCSLQQGDRVAVYSDNSPTVSWVRKKAAKGSQVADQLVRALTLRMKQCQVSPLTAFHISGKKNAMTDIPSRSFGSEPKWHCKTEKELLTLFDASFPLPHQNSWTVFQISSGLKSRILSALRMKVFEMEEWRRLPKPGRHIGRIGTPTASLWDWTLTYREEEHGKSLSWQSEPTWHRSEEASGAMAARSELVQYLRRSRPLMRRSLWPHKDNH